VANKGARTPESNFLNGISNDDNGKHGSLVLWPENLHQYNIWETFENIKENAELLLKEDDKENPHMENCKIFRKKRIRNDSHLYG